MSVGSSAAADVPPPIFLVCHRHDYFLARIAIASIRYYYPSVELNVIPDHLNGTFDTSDIERYFGVRIVRLGTQRFGWTSAKICLLLAESMSPGTKFIMMDPDIVLVGRALDCIASALRQYDFVVSPEFSHKPGTRDFARTYYNPSKIKQIYPDFHVPGFTFNAGLIGATSGVLTLSEVRQYFDPTAYPYWTPLATEVLPTRDQSLLNILLPMRQQQSGSVLHATEFMWWFLQSEVAELRIDEVEAGKYPRVIHWAGGRRIAYLGGMVRGDILRFFQKQYFARLPAGLARYYADVWKNALTYHLWLQPAHVFGFSRIPDWTTPAASE